MQQGSYLYWCGHCHFCRVALPFSLHDANHKQIKLALCFASGQTAAKPVGGAAAEAAAGSLGSLQLFILHCTLWTMMKTVICSASTFGCNLFMVSCNPMILHLSYTYFLFHRQSNFGCKKYVMRKGTILVLWNTAVSLLFFEGGG